MAPFFFSNTSMMQRISILFCVYVLFGLLQTHSVCAERIVVCAGSQQSLVLLTEAAKAAAEDVFTENIINSTILPAFSFASVLLTDSSIENEALTQAQVGAGAALAIVDSQDGIVADTFGASNIPVLLVSNTIPSSKRIKTKVELSPLGSGHAAIISLFKSFSWNSAGLIYAPQYDSVATQLASMASSSAPSITFSYNTTIDSTFPNSVFSSIVSDLEQGVSRVVVIVAPFRTVSRLFAAIRDVKFEFVIFDPMTSQDMRSSLDLSPLARTSISGNPRGVFVISPEENGLAVSATNLRLQAYNSTYFANGAPALVLAAYDGVFLYANSVADIYNNTGDISNGTLVHSSLIRSPKSAIFAYTFDTTTLARVGNLAIWNLHVNITSGNMNWTKVSSWSGSSDAASIADASALTFADGTSTVPRSSQDSTIAIGILCPSIRAVHKAWKLLVYKAIDDINADGTLLPADRKFRAVYADNLDSASTTITAGVDLVSRGVVAVIGPSRSTQSVALQYYLGGPKVPAISFASTLDPKKSFQGGKRDKINYPMFFRTVVRDSFQSKAIAALIKYEGWKDFCIINYIDDYAAGIVSNLISEATTLGLNVIGRGTYTQTAKDFSPALSPIISAGCRIIVAVIDSNSFGGVMRQAKESQIFGRGSSGFVWIFSEIANSVIEANNILLQNMTLSDFHGSLLTMPIDGLVSNPVFRHYQNISQPIMQETALTSISYGSFAYDAVWAAAIAASKTIASGKEPLADRAAYVSNLKTVSFTGASGGVSFDSNQDRVGGIYGIYNFRERSKGVVPVGLWTIEGVNMTDLIIFSDNTTKIPADVVNPDSTRPITAILFASGGGGIITAVAALALVTFVSTAIFIFIKSRDIADTQSWDIIRKSSPVFLGIILLGLCLAVISVFFWFSPSEDPTGPARCHLRVWFAFIGCGVAYAALLAKNWRLWYLFNEPTLRVIAIKNQQLLTILGAVMLPLVIVMVLWSSINPFQDTLQVNAARTLRYRVCVSTNDIIFAPISFAYMGLLLVFGSVLSWKTRTLPDAFKESQYIALSTYNLLFVAIVGVLVGYVLSFEPPAYTYIITVCILVGSLATWALLFIPKFYIMRYGPPSSRSGSAGSSVLARGGSALSIASPKRSNAKPPSMKTASGLHPSSDEFSDSSSSSEEAPRAGPTSQRQPTSPRQAAPPTKQKKPAVAQQKQESSADSSASSSVSVEKSKKKKLRPPQTKKASSESSSSESEKSESSS